MIYKVLYTKLKKNNVKAKINVSLDDKINAINWSVNSYFIDMSRTPVTLVMG